jgi:imidazolonepropionase
MTNTAVWIDCRLATGTSEPGSANAVTVIDDAAVVISDETIAWVGPRSLLPGQWDGLPPQSCGGCLLTPGLVDAFTPLYPGPADGMDDDDYVAQALAQLAKNLAQGVTWREFKTGAEASMEGALRQLLLAQRIKAAAAQRVSVTLRAAQVREDDENHDVWMETLCTKLIPSAHNSRWVDAVEALSDDGFDEVTGEARGFSLDDASTVLEAAYKKKIPTRLGCERYADTGAVALAPSFYARCAAYLNFCDELGVDALAQARTTAMLLPFAQLPDQPLPPVEELRRRRIPIALGTEGVEASPLRSARRACELYGFSAADAFVAVTVAAARVLGGPNADSRAGTLSAGAPADMALWNAANVEALLQVNPDPVPRRVWVRGQLLG